MAFGPFFAVPALIIIFAISVRYKNLIVDAASKIKIPRIWLALLTAIPFLIVEEHINCGAYGCAVVVLPPTIWFLLAEMLVFLFIFQTFHIHKMGWQLATYGIFGTAFEFFLGSGKTGLHTLASSNPLIFIFMILWICFSYIFLIYFPLIILNQPGGHKPDNKNAA
ncbi:hypothetical protein KGQ24_01480 [Patescibacteria group bacterium]|nr:hypothetical protein [Patescibacteria group bacterium]